MTGFTACKHPADADWVFRLQNNSDHLVYFYASFTEQDKLVPTTQWLGQNEFVVRYNLAKAIAHKSGSFNLSWGDVREDPADSIAVFVISPDTIAKYDWNEIGEQKKYLKKYVMTIQELGTYSYYGLPFPDAE